MPVTIGAPREHGFDEPLGVLSDCHRRVERFLGVIVSVSQSEGPLGDAERAALGRALNYFRDAAPKHTADEEESLFPRLRAKDEPELRTLLERVERLEEDHRRAGPAHEELDRLGRVWIAVGELPAPEHARFRRLADELEALYRDHIRVEDIELFPAAARVLTRSEAQQIGAEMASRRQVSSRNQPAPPSGCSSNPE